MSIDIDQRRCGHDGCNAWRLSRPGTEGKGWAPCWKCRTDSAPTGESLGEFLARPA
jgi:hypothetical protein